MKKMYLFVSILVAAVMLLTACGPAAHAHSRASCCTCNTSACGTGPPADRDNGACYSAHAQPARYCR